MAGVSRFLTPPERKQGNGLAERTIRTVREYLRAVGDAHKSDWADLVPAMQHALNTAPSAAVGSAPAQILLGYLPRGPLHVVLPDKQSEEVVFLHKRAVLQRRAKNDLFESQVSRVKDAMEARNATEPWRVGDQAFVDGKRLNNPDEAHLPEKMRSQFHGPFEVTRVEHPNIFVHLPLPFRDREHKVNMDDAFIFTPFSDPTETAPGPVEPLPPVPSGEAESESGSVCSDDDGSNPLYEVEAVTQ